MPESPFSSCNPKEPFIKLDTGTAPILRYNIPQETCFGVNSIMPLLIDLALFKSETKEKPVDNFWDAVSDFSLSDASQAVIGAAVASPNYALLSSLLAKQRGFNVADLVNNQYSIYIQEAVVHQEVNSGVGGKKQGGGDVGGKKGNSVGGKKEPGNITVPVTGPPASPPANVPNDIWNVVAQEVTLGYKPIIRKNFYGTPTIHFLPEPKVPIPKIYLVFHFKVCSYLGDYGAGKTLKTFSLLPGEKTEISVRSFKNFTESKKKSENILDSFSETSAAEFESIVRNEFTHGDYRDLAGEDLVTRYGEGGGGVNITLPVQGVPIGLSGGGGGGSSSSFLNSINSGVFNTTNVIGNTIRRHVNASSHAREIEVSTDVSQLSTVGEENSTIRRLENINFSRVLNFVFRQMLQEYITITSLQDVSVVYSNGYDESKIVVKLDGLEDLLNSVLIDGPTVSDVKQNIFAELGNIYDYLGVPQSLVEEVTEVITGGCGSGTVNRSLTYCRKKRNLSNNWSEGGISIDVPGIIMDVKKHVLRTDSLVTDALLGQGEALDCYNMKLQDSAAISAQYRNERFSQETVDMKRKLDAALDVINLVADPEAKAEAFKKMLNACCSEDLMLLMGNLCNNNGTTT